MEDRFAVIFELAIISNSQQEHLNHCSFSREGLFPDDSSPVSDDIPLNPTGIFICSPPTESMDVDPDEEFYLTPEEHLLILPEEERTDLDMQVESIIVGESSGAVDLGRDTDLLFPNNVDASGNLVESEVSRSESIKNVVLETKSQDLGIPESERVELVAGGSVEKPIDAQMEVFPGVTEIVWANGGTEVSGELARERPTVDVFQVVHRDTTGTEVLKSEKSPPANGASSENVLDSNNPLQNNAGNAVELDKFGVDKPGALGPGSMPETSQVLRKLPNWLEESVRNAEELGCAGGEGDGLSSAQGERLGEAGSSAQGEGMTVGEGSSAETPVQRFVSLTDLVDPDDDDILVVAIKAGMQFPRPRWWRPDGYGCNSSPSNN